MPYPPGLYEDYREYEPWEPLPKHYWWRRLWGYDLRRWCNHPMTGGWEYGKSSRVALQVLKEEFDRG